jgi:tRNA threonylcarbamoyladenosine biosynthesis protein TsaB
LRLLGVDTTTARGSVALAEDDDVLGEVRFHAPGRHSSHVVPAVEFLLKTLGLRPSDIEGYAVTVGPGPFTGLRIGISTVQGLAMSAGRRALGMSSLDVLATRIRGEAETLVAMIDAGRGQIYGGVYDRSARPLREPAVDVPSQFLEGIPDGAAFLGDGVRAHEGLIQSLKPNSVFPSRSLFLAGTLARLAASSFGEAGDPGALRPLYLRGADIRKAAPRPEGG